MTDYKPPAAICQRFEVKAGYAEASPRGEGYRAVSHYGKPIHDPHLRRDISLRLLPRRGVFIMKKVLLWRNIVYILSQNSSKFLTDMIDVIIC